MTVAADPHEMKLIASNVAHVLIKAAKGGYLPVVNIDTIRGALILKTPASYTAADRVQLEILTTRMLV